MPFLAAEPVQIRLRQRPARRQRVPKRIVQLSGHHNLIRIDETSHVAVSVRMIIGVRNGTGSEKQRVVRASQEAANAARTFQPPAQILPPRVGGGWQAVRVAFLDHQIPVIHITNFVR